MNKVIVNFKAGFGNNSVSTFVQSIFLKLKAGELQTRKNI